MNNNDNNTPENGDSDKFPSADVLPFERPKPTVEPVQQTFPTAKPPVPKPRLLQITFKDPNKAPVLIEGFVGFTSAFLAVGDADRDVKYAVADGEWATVEDLGIAQTGEAEAPA